jgi:hypothetical protein
MESSDSKASVEITSIFGIKISRKSFASSNADSWISLTSGKLTFVK